MGLVFIDCEAWGGTPSVGQLTEFGAVAYPSKITFHGLIVKSTPDPECPARPLPTARPSLDTEIRVFTDFDMWLTAHGGSGRPVMVSDNPAYDFQWINDGFWRTLGRNPLGFSARRLGDFFAGMQCDFYAKQEWKKFRITRHDHHPVNDAMGNVEAFEEMLRIVKDLRAQRRT